MDELVVDELFEVPVVEELVVVVDEFELLFKVAVVDVFAVDELD